MRNRGEGSIPDTLLLLEHPHVITVGRGGGEGHILWDEATRDLRGVEVFRTGRGGDVTYHGPGQLVGYPILSLEPDRCDVRRYVRDLEELLIRALRDYDIAASRVPGRTGVWVGEEKIAAIGVRVARWITSHGFALNVQTDLSYFSSIVPCGIAGCRVTSVKQLLGRSIAPREVARVVATRFEEVFGIRLPWAT